MGSACQTTRDFALIDEDQSDNTYAHYLLNGNGQTAQNTPANKNAMGGARWSGTAATTRCSAVVDPANGCKPFTEPSTTDANGEFVVAGAERTECQGQPDREDRRPPGQ